MSKLIVLSAVVLAAGIEGIVQAFQENPEGAAADVMVLETQRKDALEVAEKLLAEVEKQPSAKAENAASFSHDENHYGFNFKAMTHKGKRITIQDVLDNEELQRELVELQSGMIRRIP